MKQKIIFSVLIVLTVLITAFIFSNSCKDQTRTMEESGAVTEILTPVIENVSNFGNQNFENFIRKLAHVCEFSILGGVVYALFYFLKINYKIAFFGYALFYLLFVGVIDEYIQSYYGRTSSVNDVLIDFSGGLLGLIVSCLIIKIILFFIKKFKSTECKSLGRKKV